MLDSMAVENPFQDPLRFERRVPECVIVIFGANGDLTKRKLMPALYRLAYDRRLSAGFAVVGISRTPLTDEQFREKMREAVKEFSEDTKFDEDVWRGFAEGLFYIAGDIGDAGAVPAARGEARRDRDSAPHRRQCPVLSLHPAQPVRADRPGHRQGRAAARATAGAGWSSRSRSATISPARAN